ncbi:T9SS type A sorting domain-containing protein [bacterium]|nr:T9SS type A sorting domain-containing protein [bacterium]
MAFSEYLGAYRLVDVDYNGAMGYHESQIGMIEIPKQFKLNKNYPNPFNPSTKIDYELPQNSKVLLEVYNILGQKVKTLVDGVIPFGFHQVIWDGHDDHQSSVASGVYMYRMMASGLSDKQRFQKTQKMILVK